MLGFYRHVKHLLCAIFVFCTVALSSQFAFAEYMCPTAKYTSCASGYFMTYNGVYNATPQAGNACTACPSGWTCSGGTAAPTRTITLNKNGGSGTIQGKTGTTAATITCTYGLFCSFGSASGLSQTGYAFTGGWGTSSTCTSTTTSFANPSGTYYACKRPKYTITVKPNGATSHTSDIVFYEVYGSKFINTSGQTITSIPSMTRTGYTLAGYYTAATGGTQKIPASGVLPSNTTFTANTTLYAQWTPVTYTITLNDNSGVSGSGTVKEVYNTKWTNSSGTTITSVTKPTRTGYTFKGYYTTATGGTQKIPASGVLPSNTTFTANTTLYAKWTIKSVTCPAGTYLKAGGTTTSDCATCPAGSYCPGGTFSYDNTKDQGINACSNKPANSVYSGTGATTSSCPWSCNAGYYGSSANGNTACAACGSGNFCTGGTHRATCTSVVKSGSPTPTAIYSLSNGSWSDYTHATKSADCVCSWNFSDETRTNYLMQTACQNGPSGNEYTKYYDCRTGYYATNPLTFNQWYTACAKCTNGPSNSEYTSYSTPSADYAVESNCPWRCEANYYKSGSSCAACSGVSFTDSGSDTETITGGTRTRTKSRTCYRTTSAAGSTASSACTGSGNCGSYTYGTWVATCNAGYSKSSDGTTCNGNTYTITLDPDLDKIGPYVMDGYDTSVVATYGAAMPEIVLPQADFAYTFGGYYTAKNGQGTKYYDDRGTSVRNWDKTSGATLYAHWVPNSGHLAFDANGGSGTAPTPPTVCTFESCIVPENTYTAPDGYNFAGWSYESDLQGYMEVPAGENIGREFFYYFENGQTITLSAIWKPICYPFEVCAASGANNESCQTMYQRVNDLFTVYSDDACSDGYEMPTDVLMGYLPNATVSGFYDVLTDTECVNNTMTPTGNCAVAADGSSSWVVKYQCADGYSASGGSEYAYPGDACTLSTYEITLNAGAGVGLNPTKIYAKPGSGWYSDAAAGNKITSVTMPYSNQSGADWLFMGFFTEQNGSGTQVISKNGNIVAPDFMFEGPATVYAYYEKCQCTAGDGVESCVSIVDSEGATCKYQVTCESGYNKRGSFGTTTFTGSGDAHVLKTEFSCVSSDARTGYVCPPDSLYYISCNEGKYMAMPDGTNTDGTTKYTYNGTPQSGNSCENCPENAAYCPGGTSAPLYLVDLVDSVLGQYGTIYGNFNAEYYTCESVNGTYECTPIEGRLPEDMIPSDSHPGYTFNGFVDENGDEYIDANGNFLKGPSSYTALEAQWSQCAAGTFEQDGVCVTCPKGSYCADGVKNTCSNGTYQDTTGQSSCKKCPTANMDGISYKVMPMNYGNTDMDNSGSSTDSVAECVATYMYADEVAANAMGLNAYFQNYYHTHAGYLFCFYNETTGQYTGDCWGYPFTCPAGYRHGNGVITDANDIDQISLRNLSLDEYMQSDCVPVDEGYFSPAYLSDNSVSPLETLNQVKCGENSSTNGANCTCNAGYNYNLGTTTTTEACVANQYTVTFDANGGTGEMPGQTFTYGVAQNLTTNTFTRTGYKFNGWNTASDGSGDTYDDAESVKNLTDENGVTIRLYAQWEQDVYSCDPGYYWNGTQCVECTDFEYYCPGVADAVYGTEKGKVDCPAATNQYGSINYFMGSWFDRAPELMDSADACIATYMYSSKRMPGMTDDDIAADWDSNSEANKKGAAIVDCFWDAETQSYTKNCTGSANLCNAGYYSTHLYPDDVLDPYAITFSTDTLDDFVDQFCMPVGSGYYSPSAGFNSSESVIVDSLKRYQCPVSTDGRLVESPEGADGASDCYVTCPTSIDIDNGTTTVIDETPNYPSYACKYNAECDTGYHVNNQGTTEPSCSINTYTVYMYGNGGYIVNSYGTNQTSMSRTYGDGVALPVGKFERAGYIFTGWNTAADGSGTSYADGTTENLTDENGVTITLYAQWSQCAAGTFEQDGACVICPKGSYCANGIKNKCSSGTYADKEGMSECTTCPAGTNQYGAAQFAVTSSKVTEEYDIRDSLDTCAAMYYYMPEYMVEMFGITVQDAIDMFGYNPDSDANKRGFQIVACSYNSATDTYTTNCEGYAPYCTGGYYSTKLPANVNYDTLGEDLIFEASTLDEFLAQACVPVGTGYWSPDGEGLDFENADEQELIALLQRNQCPDNGTTATTTSDSSDDCYKTNMSCTLENGSGETTCHYTTDGYTNCAEPCVATNCNDGYYLNDGACVICPKGSYCANGVKTACDPDYTTSSTGATNAAQCTKSCEIACIQQTCPDNATCIHGTETVAGTQIQGGTCDAVATTCTITVTCDAGYYMNNGVCDRAEFTVTFNANGGTGTMADQTFTYGVPQNLTTNAFIKSGFVFAGWNTASDGSGTDYDDKALISNLLEDITLYAQWSVAKLGCDAGFYLDGAECKECTPGHYCEGGEWMFQEGKVQGLLACPELYPDSAALSSKQSDCTITCAGGQYVATKYAACENVGEGYWIGVNTVGYGEISTRNACDDNMTTIGYGPGADEADDCGHKLHVNDEVLYLRKAEKTDVSLHIKIDGVEFYGNMRECDIKISDGATQTLRIKYGDKVYSVYDDSQGDINEDCELISYNIEYALNGGDESESLVTKYNVKDTTVLNAPTRENSVFVGWYDNPEFTGNAISKIVPGTVGAKKLYAKWGCASGFIANAANTACVGNGVTISFDANGGSDVANSTCIYGESLTLSNVPVKFGYDFTGWQFTNGQFVDAKNTNVPCEYGTIGAYNGTASATAQWAAKSIECAAGTYLPANSETCASCPAGYACAGGTYKYSTNSEHGNVMCSGSTYSESGASTCSTCPDGYTISIEGDSTAHDEISDCKITCTAGSQLLAGASECSKCGSQSYCVGGEYGYNASESQGIESCPTSKDTWITSDSALWPVDQGVEYDIPSAGVNAWSTNKSSVGQCTVSYHFKGLNDQGGIGRIEAVRYNTATGLYDIGGLKYFDVIYPGYYAYDRIQSCDSMAPSHYVMYENVALCPEGYYCPGYDSNNGKGTLPPCSSELAKEFDSATLDGEFAFLFYKCPEDRPNSPAGSDSEADCY